MKLYDYGQAPNPRRVKIFLAEKGVEYEIVNCDMMKGEHKTPEFLKKNPSGKIPVLELDDGRCLAESVAICRYIEGMYPEPNLFGNDPFEMGFIEMRNRHLETELWSQIGVSWVNGPVVAAMGIHKQIPAAKEASDENVSKYYQRLDCELGESEYIAGPRFTVADITLLTAIDFAAALVDLKPDESLENLWRWHSLVSARDSVVSLA
ncbi:MAG: glutathione S-transferase [SAR86 cluster bacterium]|uniref:Glutathione S-transferase n=1 Tax=SAR86 cluster bacterium TaxID=2030880 RepID=A0A2A5B1M0_9GAMM|nr:MAG: glutathione S-transferase [SAR86 cluster bacterium]